MHPCLVFLCLLLALHSREALEGVRSSQMIVRVYREVKTPEETSAMMGSGSMHIHRETQAQCYGVNGSSGKHGLRQFGDAFPVRSGVKPCVGATFGSSKGEVSVPSFALNPRLNPSWLSAPPWVLWASLGSTFPVLALDFPDYLDSFQKYKGIFGALDLMCPCCIPP